MEPPKKKVSRWVFIGVLAVSVGYVLTLIDKGWIPHDEGTLGQAALRVLRGELPHADFDDMYTGGQALWHALVFDLLGVRLLNLRLALLVAFTGAVAASWYIARRFAGPLAAALAVLLSVAWSIPNYPAAMPSWYNLFFAIWAVAAVLRYLDTERRRWLVIAGVAAGLSIAVKIVGLYLLAALFLFAVYREQELSRSEVGQGNDGPGHEAGGEQVGFRLLVTVGLTVFGALVALVTSRLPGVAVFFHFTLPPLLVAGWLVAREWRGHWRPGRIGRLVGLVAPMVAGAVVPLMAFLAPYIATDTVGALFHGVFILPMERFDFAIWYPPGPLTALPLAALVIAAILAARRGGRTERSAAVGVGVLLLGVLVFGAWQPAYRLGWWLLRPLVPVLALVGVIELARLRPEVDARKRQGAVALLATTVMVSLVQFPTGSAVYVFYVAPLVPLLALALLSLAPAPPRWTAGALAVFHVLFAVLWIHTASVYFMGDHYARHPAYEPLRLERAGLKVEHVRRVETERLVGYLRLSTDAPYIWATPDAPEVYFLSGKRNPTRTLFDFFDDPEGREERLIQMLRRDDVGAVVLNRRGIALSPAPPRPVREFVEQAFPVAVDIGRFEVRLRTEPDLQPPEGGD